MKMLSDSLKAHINEKHNEQQANSERVEKNHQSSLQGLEENSNGCLGKLSEEFGANKKAQQKINEDLFKKFDDICKRMDDYDTTNYDYYEYGMDEESQAAAEPGVDEDMRSAKKRAHSEAASSPASSILPEPLLTIKLSVFQERSSQIMSLVVASSTQGWLCPSKAAPVPQGGWCRSVCYPNSR